MTMTSQPPTDQQSSSTKTSTRQAKRAFDATDPTAPTKTRSSKRLRTKLAEAAADINELPHNLGKLPVVKHYVPVAAGPAISGTFEKSSTKIEEDEDGPASIIEVQIPVDTSNQRKGGRKAKNPYGLTPGISPYPEWSHPTPEECEEVNRLLSSIHGEVIAPKAIPPPSLTVSGCGEVPSILDALIRTLLSGATTGTNSAMAFQGLVQKFGILQDGIGKGSVDWNKVRKAPVEEIFGAMKCGGLGASKSKYIKQILNMVYEENMARRNALVEAKQGTGLQPAGADNETEEQKDNEIAQAEEHILSLNHLHALSKDEAMLQFVRYPGIGVKTAACVILFCLQRPCFAVDTHVFRLSKWLGWIPSDKVNEITAFSHLEVRVPDHLKYSLHQLFLMHGKTCPRCRAITGENSDGWEDGCVIDHLVKRSGKRKGGSMKQTKLSFSSPDEE